MGFLVFHPLFAALWLAGQGAAASLPELQGCPQPERPWSHDIVNKAKLGSTGADDSVLFVQLSAVVDGGLKPFVFSADAPWDAPWEFDMNQQDLVEEPFEGNTSADGLNMTLEMVHRLMTLNFTQRKKCNLHTDPREANVSNYFMDNSHLQHASKGITYRFTKVGKDRDSRSIAFWGSTVRGVDEGDGWLRVGECYLPLELKGKRVAVKTEAKGQGNLEGAGEFPFNKIQAVEAKPIPGGTRITIVTGGGGTAANWTEGRTYSVEINGSLSNFSNYESIPRALRGQMGLKFKMDVNSSMPHFASMFRTVNGSNIFIPTGSIIMAAEKQIPVWEIKAAIADAVQEGISKAEAAAQKNHTEPTMEAVRQAVQAEVWGTWNRMAKTMWASRFKRRDHKSATHACGIAVFFQSVPIFDWCLVVVAILLFAMQHWGLLHWPSTRAFHGTALILWFILAGLYSVLIFKRQGTTEGILWLNGYVLELIFLIENVLVTHIIIQAFRTPRWVNEKALFIVVIARIIFQMIFYMGLAELVFSGEALPYVLGLWLLYIAWQAALDDDDSSFDIMDARVVHLARAAFGERLWLSRDDSGALFLLKENKRRLSLVGLMVFCLVLVDALLHVDVALTKIEELQGDGYLCFSSAAVASFCLPELVFVIRDLFRIFPGLKYGISAVLIYISAQMLLHAIFRPPIFADLAIFIGCLVFSAMLPWLGLLPRNAAVRSVDAGTQACLPPGKDCYFPPDFAPEIRRNATG